MKKTVTIIVGVALAGMIGWTLVEFLSNDKNDQVDESGGVTITSPSEESDEAKATEDSDDIGLEKGKMAPDFELETLDGDAVQLSDYQGQDVIVNFWATWCPPCRDEIPHFQKLYDNKDVEILAVNLDESHDRDKVETFVNEDFEMTFPVLLDEDFELASTYQVQAYPTSYMVDEDGRIQFVAIGAMEYEQMEKQLEKMN